MRVDLAGNSILILLIERDVHAAHALLAILQTAHADVILAIGSADALGRNDAPVLDGIGCAEVCKGAW
jgi:hypothetical protein